MKSPQCRDMGTTCINVHGIKRILSSCVQDFTVRTTVRGWNASGSSCDAAWWEKTFRKGVRKKEAAGHANAA